MENKRQVTSKDGKLLTASAGAICLGAFSFTINPLMGILTLAAGVGGVLFDTGIFNKSSKGTTNVTLIEKIFFETGIRKLELDDNKKPIYVIPEVLGIRDEGDKRIVDLKVPMGFSMRELNQRCYFALKDYFNCIDIEFNTKGECLYEMVLLYSKEKPKELSVWDKFWLSVGVYTGEKPNYVLPKLLGVEEIKGGRRFVFMLPLGKSSHHLTKVDTTIKEFMNARMVNIVHLKGTKDGVLVGIDAIMDELPTNVPFSLEGEKDSKSFKILLGDSLFGKVFIDMINIPHLLLAGATNSGKSVMLKAILMYLLCRYSPNELEVYLADLKRTELLRFKNIKHVKKCVYSVEDTHTMMKEVLDECNRRCALFEMNGHKSNIIEYNNSVSDKDKLPFMFVVIEEYVRYTNGGGNDVKERQTVLNDLISVCRATGIYVCLTVQRPTKNTLGDILKANIGNIIGFKTVDKENSKVICEDTNLLGNLRGNGNGYLFSGTDKVEFQGMYLSNSDINKLIKEYKLEK